MCRDEVSTWIFNLANQLNTDKLEISSFALAELYIIIACLFRRFDLELYDTIRERDIDVVRDCFIGEVAPNSVGVRIKAKTAPTTDTEKHSK